MASPKKIPEIISIVEKMGELLTKETEIGEVEGPFFRIQIEEVVNDPETLEIMENLELYNPEKMIKFLVDSVDKNLEEFQNQIQELKELEIKKQIGKIRSAESSLMYGIENPEEREEELNSARKQLADAICTLMEFVSVFIERIRDIDNKPFMAFWITSAMSMRAINSNMKLIRISLDVMEEAMVMLMIIAKELGKKIDRSYIEPYYKFYDEILLCGDTCRLLDGYEIKNRKEEQYFLKLEEKKGNFKKLADAYDKYKKTFDELEEYENVIF